MDECTTRLLHIAAENPDLPVVYVTDSVIAEFGEKCLSRAYEVTVGEVCLYKGYVYTDKGEFIDDYFSNNEDELTDRFNYDSSKVYEYVGDKYVMTKDPKVLESLKNLDDYLAKVADEAFRKAIIVTTGPVDESLVFEED